MKICKTCGNLLSETDYNCQKCGTPVELAYMNNQQTPQMGQTMVANSSNHQKKDSENKALKIVTLVIIVGLIALSTYLGVQNSDLKKKIELAEKSTDNSYKVSDNTNTTSNQVQITANEENYNFEIPEGTYPKVSQNYVFFVPDDYVATVLEQSGGISLLNLKSGGSGWIAMNNASLEAYRGQKDALKQTYISQGVQVNNMYDTTLGGKDALVLEITNKDQPTLLVIVDGPSGGCFVLTITNTNDKTKYDTATANELVTMIGKSQRLS